VPQYPLYQTSPIPYFPTQSQVVAGYTQRQLPVTPASYTGQRSVQTYMTSVSVLVHAGVWLHEVTDVNPRQDLKGISPFQLYEVYVTSMTSPDGDIPYKHGDTLVPTGALAGLISNTGNPIRGVFPAAHYVKLHIERPR
jgi:hypothetical protein